MQITGRSPRPMPAVFFGHGSPMVTVEDNAWVRAWQALGAEIDAHYGRPRAVLMVSAHWCTVGVAVTSMNTPRTIHDFNGFPPALYQIQYPAPGSPWLAERVRALLADEHVHADVDWGLDHGCWAVLRHAWPDADVPVVQLSLDLSRPARDHLELARALAPLRDEGVVIAGSGNVVHNLRTLDWQAPERASFDWAQRFEDWVRVQLTAGEVDALADYAALGTDAALSVPTPEHYLPLLYVAAQRRQGEPISLPAEGQQFGSISMLSVRVG